MKLDLIKEIDILSEANVYASRYAAGQKVSYVKHKSSNIPGAKEGDEFEKVKAPKSKETKVVDLHSGKGEAKNVFLKGKDGKVFELIGSASLINQLFRNPPKETKSGGKTASATQWETLLVVAWNTKNKKNIKNNSKLLTDAKISDEQFNTNKKIATKIIKHLDDLPAEEMVHFGDSRGKLDSKWGGTNATPKTDMYMKSKKQRLSLKKAGGSQLMSGSKEEAIATFMAASKSLSTESSTTLKKLTKDMDNTFGKFISELSGVEIRRIIKDTPNKKDIPKELLEFISKTEAHKKLQTQLRDFFSDEPEFAKWVVFEAMTGKQKFKDKISDATHILKFNPTDGSSIIKKITPAYAATIAKQINVQVNFKTAGGSSIKSSALRVADMSSFTPPSDNMLNEGLMVDFVKKMFKKIIDWLKEAFAKSIELGLEYLGIEPTVKFAGIDSVEF